MKLMYYIAATGNEKVKVERPLSPIQIGNSEVQWYVENNNLTAINIVFSGLEINRDDQGVILSEYPDIDDAAFKVASYVSNQILAQTAIEAINPRGVFDHARLVGETEDETKALNGKIRVQTSFTLSYSITGDLNISVYGNQFDYSSAVANYSDGMRAKSPFLKYEQYYKVIENFFKEESEDFDRAVSKHVSQYDHIYNQCQIMKLRHLRNRCIHPQARYGHLNPENIKDIRLIESHLDLIQKLAMLLLKNPPLIR